MFAELITWIDSMGSAQNHPAVLLVLGLAAMIEYVVPPFPGDSVTLLGAVLVGAYDWNLALVFLALMLGSLFGSAGAYALGLRWSRSHRMSDNDRLAGLVVRFKRHGVWLLMLNRFMPGIRPLFFVAAGLAKMPLLMVLLTSALSAMLWNTLLMVLGAYLGQNLTKIESWMRSYALYSWTLVGIFLVGWLLLHLWRRRSKGEN